MTTFAVHFTCGSKKSIQAPNPELARQSALRQYEWETGKAGRISKVKAKRS